MELESQEQERQADVEHRKKIHTEIFEVLRYLGPGLDVSDEGDKIAKRVFMALLNNEIPHTHIQY